MKVYLWTIYSTSLYVCFQVDTTAFWLPLLCNIVWNSVKLPVCSFSRLPELLSLLWFHMNFKIVYYHPEKYAIRVLVGIVLSLKIVLDSMDIIPILSLPVHACRMSFHLFGFPLISFNNILSFLESSFQDSICIFLLILHCPNCPSLLECEFSEWQRCFCLSVSTLSNIVFACSRLSINACSINSSMS